MNSMVGHRQDEVAPRAAPDDALSILTFLEEFSDEIEDGFDMVTPEPHFRMALHLLRGHFEARVVTPTSVIGASRVPYATANRRLKDMIAAGLIEQRPRTATGKSFSMHPSDRLLSQWMQMSGRVRRLCEQQFGRGGQGAESKDYFFGGSYSAARSIPPLPVRTDPLKLASGLRVLVHGDPTFMVMVNLKRQFEQAIGVPIKQRAFSIDRLRAEALRNAARPTSRYDIIAVDLPWMGEFAEAGVLMPLERAFDIARLDPADFHTAGWSATHWGGTAYGVPAQTTPELLFYRRDLFAEAGLRPPETTDDLLDAARTLHQPQRGRYGIAWNAARGTALGHTVLMTMADFGQPVVSMPEIAGGFDTASLARHDYRATIDTPAGLAAAEFLMQLLDYSPPDILSMSWYERIRPYAAGRAAMAYGYTLLAPYFENDPSSPAHGQTGYLPHPPVRGGRPIAHVGGYALGIPANLPRERIAAAAEALCVFTSPEAQKLYVQNGSRTNPRYTVAADPEVRRLSTIFEAVDEMSWRDELQFWPRPPVPEISGIFQICGEEFHDMLRGVQSPRAALRAAQARADDLLKR
ncbi:carbohydrate ABC transporter substrate-binding protein, CUT1 family (TC 3.A.1.1.-) [Palleronia salina]|uniref:Carbohydrate ABC transporter substrate-binding protein, CUT1 family (TC 3.A.1.1.-) n=1 Tax=Palleronia salina TaxID=313368 RepID=A0A1M6L6T1_9RHOB|nr:extracellular solute-binding protein [Palleronia salina]SHJ66759.1 carbohydrate ABC transporter substrate-binding protein, CUT1 family (TC 3.A.1.1.-) [Palleronia salina]